MPLSTMTLYCTPWSIQRNVQSLHYLCCSHDCSSGCNIQPFSPKMHQCVIAFVLRLANIVVNFLKQLRKKPHKHGVSHHHCQTSFMRYVSYISWCYLDLILCLVFYQLTNVFPDSDTEERGKEKWGNTMTFPVSCPPANTSLTA